MNVKHASNSHQEDEGEPKPAVSKTVDLNLVHGVIPGFNLCESLQLVLKNKLYVVYEKLEIKVYRPPNISGTWSVCRSVHPWAPGSQLWQQTFTLKHPEDRALGVFWKSNFKTWKMFEGFFLFIFLSLTKTNTQNIFYFIFKALIEKVITYAPETWLLVLTTPSFRTKVTWKLAVLTQMWPTSVVFFRPPLVHRSYLNEHGRCACWCPDVSVACVLMFVSPHFQIPALFLSNLAFFLWAPDFAALHFREALCDICL